MSGPLERFLHEAKKALGQNAEDSMMFPKADPFEHGVQVGKYQGMRMAMDLVEDIIRDNLEKENHS